MQRMHLEKLANLRINTVFKKGLEIVIRFSYCVIKSVWIPTHHMLSHLMLAPGYQLSCFHSSIIKKKNYFIPIKINFFLSFNYMIKSNMHNWNFFSFLLNRNNSNYRTRNKYGNRIYRLSHVTISIERNKF